MVGRALSQPRVQTATGERSGLDGHLGRGWALLELGAAGEVAREPFWTGARRVRLLPRDEEYVGGDDLVDITGSLVDPAHPLARPHVLLVRPDRYVAAVLTSTSAARVLAELRTYVDLSPHQETR
jgi:3-(3-hydroxy-phenyl)propionate hydroxylase